MTIQLFKSIGGITGNVQQSLGTHQANHARNFISRIQHNANFFGSDDGDDDGDDDGEENDDDDNDDDRAAIDNFNGVPLTGFGGSATVVGAALVHDQGNGSSTGASSSSALSDLAAIAPRTSGAPMGSTTTTASAGAEVADPFSTHVTNPVSSSRTDVTDLVTAVAGNATA